MQKYIEQIKGLTKPDFQSIKRIAEISISGLSKLEKDRLFNELKRGVALLDTHEQMCMYMFSYGNMHQAKLLDAFKRLPHDLYNHPFEVIDWGCGQAMGTINLFDHLKQKGLSENIKKITLIEPSKSALDRALLHVSAYISDFSKVACINSFFDNIQPDDIQSGLNIPVVNIFSNILDVAQIDLKHLANLIDSSAVSDHFLICVGPLNPSNSRMDAFFRYFNEDTINGIYNYESFEFQDGHMTSINTYKAKIYKLSYTETGHLIPIEYYPTVQFQAAYELDMVRQSRKMLGKLYNQKYSHFEVAAPFDLGASVYEDVHPILAVMNNIITRGLPTRTSVFIEEQFLNAFSLSKRELDLGEIRFTGKQNIDYSSIEKKFFSQIDNPLTTVDSETVSLQLLLTPIAIARFQKVLIEAIITGNLSLDQDTWKIIVEEADVPFAALAIRDFEQLFTNLTQLSVQYDSLKLPQIELCIVSNQKFVNSPLHLDEKICVCPSKEILGTEYDLVVTQAVLTSVSKEIESFSRFKCRNYCYFNIRTIEKQRTERVIYTSSLIKYKNLIERDPQGNTLEKENNKNLLKYFLQLLFRKEEFRSGQLPILDRALQNLPVIGLLPTGGGKSLTYQIAAFLQPGITIVVDPLKSLMKDQYDGLLYHGIDNAAYINSTLSQEEKKEREFKLESSKLLIVFLSPERLSIASFRERLKNMHDHNVYFSFGVIDEVHCVSEWGHDFRFSYLHLGRNLYNYVRAKEGSISLFGLTATASFDVLADVERELSGNGAFSLDADVIVRYENVNRLELQYKIEKVKVKFNEDNYYDQNHEMPKHLPKAVNITNHWPIFDSKGEFLDEYIKGIPGFINELQSESVIDFIKDQFIDRQNLREKVEQELITEMPDDFYAEKQNYHQAGIVFCPHVNTTPIAVNEICPKLKSGLIPSVGSFSGKDTDDSSMQNLDKFRDNKIPVMIATKAFGMGIDKPNVRFTVSMNYSSSLEAFVQEAGRAGRDRRMALSSILLSDYKLAQIRRTYNDPAFPILRIIRNKWFIESDLKTILNHFGKTIPENEILYATPANDIVKLHCNKDNRIFGFNECHLRCANFNTCVLAKVTPETKGWKQERELINELRALNLTISKKNFQYLNADYQTVMYFFNESFKGDIIEKTYMHKLLNQIEVDVQSGKNLKELVRSKGFLSIIKSCEVNDKAIVYIPYIKDEDVRDTDALDTSINRASDLSKAIYRMCCIDLIEDFTQDYSKSSFRIVAVRKEPGEYYQGLLRFLLRYYTADRAELELQKAKETPLKSNNLIDLHEIEEEIYKCLAFLTEFVYDKISEKRKRAIDDMRNFCIEGLGENDTWIESNEKLKDFIYYYFNSKYAKRDYVAENGEPFSLVEDTDSGKKSDTTTLFKYLRIIDNDVVGVGIPLDNVKHLYGAVRLISRSLTDSNPALYLLEAFCLTYMGTKGNENLENQLVLRYSEGLIESSLRANSQFEFWQVFELFNEKLKPYLGAKYFSELQEETAFLVHTNQLKELTAKYIE